jgi:hypothetical protein
MNLRRCTYLLVLLLLAGVLAQPSDLSAEELEMINRPVNTSGLTGLLFTTAPFTLPPGTWEAGAAVMTRRSLTPDYTVLNYPVTLSYGVNRSTEIALRSAFWSLSEAKQTTNRGIGDSEISFKWNFLPPKEYSARPAAAVTVTGIAPTGDRENGTYSVEHWGCRLGLAVGSEIMIEDYVMGVYADGQVVFKDLRDKEARDWYHMANAGVLLPISKYKNLQMFMEYNRVKGIDVITLRNDDFSAVTYGLRLVNTIFNVTIGSQFVREIKENHNKSSNIIAMLSVKIWQ